MVKNSLESLIAFHCAPTLAGIKAANLFTWHHTREDMADGLIDAARSRLAPYGISMEILCRCERYALIFVYREEMLGRAFTPEAECFLEGYGYAAGSSVAEKLAVLKNRFTLCGEFPHEIGVFLDYPLEDVRGFIENGGGGCKACGTWKVYGDSERALALFERYKRCTDYFCKKIDAGHEMAQLLTAVPSFN
ncbi:DUF3793 family protein [uncultured Cloacibacillus sp.]|uniref:DUF3793 family protein n=1 Tax=uncultured Cloacibacillus sp. TaxID=889794 RepID=UPI002585E995|nr:DUF3793 family protein [uncultured Cloacibacillus sp.]